MTTTTRQQNHQELIPVTTSPDGVNTVNARQLHELLGVGKDFATWIKYRITRYDFVEGTDFAVESRSPELGSGNRGASVEYHITLDMAKELSMVERTPIGKFFRKYFIQCEQRYHQLLREPAAVETNHFTDRQTAMLAMVRDLTGMGIDGRDATRLALAAFPLPKADRGLSAHCAAVEDQSDKDITALLSYLTPGVTYAVGDLGDVLPDGHRFAKGTRAARCARLGKLMEKARARGLVERDRDNPRVSRYRLIPKREN